MMDLNVMKCKNPLSSLNYFCKIQETVTVSRESRLWGLYTPFVHHKPLFQTSTCSCLQGIFDLWYSRFFKLILSL